MPKKRAKKKTPKKKAKRKGAKKRKTKKTAKKKRAKGTKNAYARRTKEEKAARSKPRHSNGFDLTDKQMLFVDHYLGAANLNATKAAILAGYSQKSAARQAHGLLNNRLVKQYLRKRMDDRRRRLEINQDVIVNAMASIVLSKPRDFLDVKNGVIIVKDLDDVPDEFDRAVVSYEQVFTKYGVGIKVKLADRIAASRLLAQHLGMLGDRQRDGNKGTIVEAMERLHAQAEEAENGTA